MIHIFIELRYQRQLARICPEILEAFYSSVTASVHRNGGSITRVSGNHLIQFEDSSIGFAFAASRFISDVRSLLEEHDNRIKEYFILVDHTASSQSTETFIEGLVSYESLIVPDDGILLTQSAVAQLSPYLFCLPLPETRLSQYTGPRITENGKLEGAKPARKGLTLSLYTDFVSDPVSLFRNLASTCADADSGVTLSEEESRQFEETAHALTMFTRFRFSPTQSEFRMVACREYLELYFQRLKASPTKCVPVTVYGTKPLPPEFDDMMERMGEQCDFSALIEPVFQNADLKTVPDDLVDMSYLLYRATPYLYIDELPDFFVFLGKQTDFMDSLGSWLQSYGILANPKDFRSLNPVLQEPIKVRAADRQKSLDRHLARFLWLKYEKGSLLPVFSLYEVLVSLGYEPPDSFLIGTLYYSENVLSALDEIQDLFRNRELADAVRSLEKAKTAYNEGLLEESSALTKTVLHTFQKENILSGEYRALSLIALQSLARNHGDDAVVYLEYALDNAERMHDPACVLSTTFDMAVVNFIIGNFHFASCGLETVEKLVIGTYAKDREVVLLFMKGRIAFELGNYRNAELYFQTASSLAAVHQIPESVTLCRVWYARSLAHQNRFATAENILASCAATVPEAYIYLLESGLISGHTVSGIVFPDTIAPLYSLADRRSADSFSWTSGFSMAEDRCYGTEPDTRIAVRMYSFFLSYYRCRFGQCEDIPGTVATLAQTARIALEAKDPYAAVYYYLCYDLGIRSKGVLPADTTTFLSRGFKYMQRRANEIEENGIREQFMQHPTWNSRLFKTARDNMLI